MVNAGVSSHWPYSTHAHIHVQEERGTLALRALDERTTQYNASGFRTMPLCGDAMFDVQYIMASCLEIFHVLAGTS
jgi:hypothetical protein